LEIIYFNQLDFDTSQLVRFINGVPRFTAPKEAHLVIYGLSVRLTLVTTGDGQLYVEAKATRNHLECLLSCFPQVCTLFSPIISTAELLDIYEHAYVSRLRHREDDIENR
jgi:hypothetical protein